MYLKSIEIAGFKSFGKKSQLDFTVPISAIVGPNGSGKSNVAEAFRFVLGEQSIKSLRGKKAEDLIFNGGKDAPRSNRASVKMVFDNTSRIFGAIDFDEVSIERIVNRDSSSEYAINGSAVRLKDIVEMLASAHIGASGHQIISQGEADRILNANIRERREMIEDALGLKIYQYKKEESLRKLEKTEEHVKQTESLRREIAPHIRFLRKQVEKIEKMAELKNELVKLYHEYFRREEEYIQYEKKSVATESAPLREQAVRLEKELAEAKATLAQSKNADAQSTDIVRIETELKSVRTTKDELARSVGRIEGEIASLARLVKKQEEASLAASTASIPFAKVEILAKQIDLEIERAHEDVGVLKQIVANVKKLIREFIETNKEARDESGILDLKADIASLEKEKSIAEARVKEIDMKETELSEEYTQLKNKIEKEKDVNRDAEKALFRIVAEQNDIRGKLGSLDARASRLAHDEEEFARELQEGGVLVGVFALRYKDVWPTDADGTPLTVEQIVSESRQAQEDRRRAIEKIKIRLEDAGVAGGDDIVKEYKETTERDEFLARELEDLIKSSESLKVLIKELDEKLTSEFKNGVAKINTEFRRFFETMFGGGTASLSVVKEKKRRRSDTALSIEGGEELADIEEDTEEGLDIEVNLPRKKIKGLMMLSGGERALTSIALLFAISAVNPPPFVILDETDAALDEANSKKYGDMIAALSQYSQLILITHNRETMSRAGIIYGVTMGADGVSRLLSIQFEEAVAVAK